MVRLPSFDSEIDTAKAIASSTREMASRLVEGLGNVPGSVDANAFDAESALLAEMRGWEKSLEAILFALVQGFGTRTDAAYARFDTVEDKTGYERLIAFFSSDEKKSRNTVRARKMAIAETLKIIMLEADAVHKLLVTGKETAIDVRKKSEPKLVASMDKRQGVVASMDEARQRDKGLAASLATLRLKIASPSDETRIAQWKADEASVAMQHGAVLAEREKLGKQHGVLDRQAVLLGDLIDLLNERISIYTLLLNKLVAEAERCIQLYHAAFGTLESLLADAKFPVSEAPLGAFLEVLMLHDQGGVTMQDIERRKRRADEALSQRRDAASETGI